MQNKQKDSIEGPFKKGVPDRLLDAAEGLFAEKGFRGTSVRQIASAADCNVASVNYYFGGKENLYLEVWRRDLRAMLDKRIASIEEVMSKSDGRPDLEDLLGSFAKAFLEPLVDKNKPHRLIRLMVRETLDPHLPPSMFVEDVVEPTVAALREPLLKACPQLDRSAVPSVVYSVVGQLVQAVRIEAMFARAGNRDLPSFDLDKFVEHIVKFSAGGIRSYVEARPK
ncbi:MAG: TetR/AcrR family transcriptional regulator [Planctomycetota bacterium]